MSVGRGLFSTANLSMMVGALLAPHPTYAPRRDKPPSDVCYAKIMLVIIPTTSVSDNCIEINIYIYICMCKYQYLDILYT